MCHGERPGRRHSPVPHAKHLTLGRPDLPRGQPWDSETPLKRQVTLNNRQQWNAGETYEVQFEFDMPVLRTGEYTITVAAQEHQQQPPVILNWIHDALLIYTQHSSTAVGLSGVPMRRITINPAPAPEAEADKDAIGAEEVVVEEAIVALPFCTEWPEIFLPPNCCVTSREPINPELIGILGIFFLVFRV